MNASRKAGRLHQDDKDWTDCGDGPKMIAGEIQENILGISLFPCPDIRLRRHVSCVTCEMLISIADPEPYQGVFCMPWEAS